MAVSFPVNPRRRGEHEPISYGNEAGHRGETIDPISSEAFGVLHGVAILAASRTSLPTITGPAKKDDQITNSTKVGVTISRVGDGTNQNYERTVSHNLSKLRRGM